MKYILLNRENIVVDILDYIRYIKLQPSNNIVIACEEKEGTGVIGSDCNTHYPLIKADTQSNPNAVNVMQVEELSENVKPKLFKYDPETNSFVYRYALEEAQNLKQEENKALFAKYLDSHPLTWIDEKEYGVTLEDQSEISLNINQYQMAVSAGVEAPNLEWHARHEECTSWSLDQLVALSLAISEIVYPVYRKMQAYKIAIYGATTLEDLDAIILTYEEEENNEESDI